MNPKEALDVLCRNSVEVIDRGELLSRLEEAAKEKRPLRVKAGFDPSAPDIHLGHTVLLRKLRQFQDLGHTVCLIIGDYTAMIGDPTGRTQTRPALTREEVLRNAATYQEQAFKILDSHPNRIIMYPNNSWFEHFTLQDFLEKIATRYTVARVLERDDFEKRMKADQPISIRELMYPLLQGYDSVHVKADIELGGTDQKFNLLVGRNLQRDFGQRPQVVMTLPLLVGLDGTQKMSKSLGNYIAVNEDVKNMFGKLMSVPDALMEIYFDLLTDVKGSEITAQIKAGSLHPRDAKKRLAETVCAFYHGAERAQKEAVEFDRVFSQRQNPENPEELKIEEKEIWIVDLLKRCGAVQSGGDARRLIEQGGVSIDGDKISDPSLKIKVKNGSLLKAGKKKFVKLIV